MTSHPANDDGAQKRDKEDDEKGTSLTQKRVEVDAWKEGCCHCAISGHQWGSLSQHGYVPLTSLKADPARRRRQVTSCQTFVPSHQNCMHCRKKSGHNSIKNSCVSSPVLFATEYPATPPGWYKMHSRQSNPDSRAQQETFHRVAQRGQGYAMAAGRNSTTFQNLRQDINQLPSCAGQSRSRCLALGRVGETTRKNGIGSTLRRRGCAFIFLCCKSLTASDDVSWSRARETAATTIHSLDGHLSEVHAPSTLGYILPIHKTSSAQ